MRWSQSPQSSTHGPLVRSPSIAGTTPLVFRHGGFAALVLDPIIDGFHLTRVLMDGGSSLNLLYQDTVCKMGIDPSRIKPTKTTFKGVIPGVEAHCTGSVTLEVAFGSPDNFRSEELIFDIVPFRRGYHALLGRTMVAKFNPWSSCSITFDRRDHPTSICHGGFAALVLDPIIDGCHLTRVLMDGGSSLNLLYQDTMCKMGIDPSRIKPTRTTFKGVIPGVEAHCTGSVTLEVVFGSPDNF